MAAGPWTGPPPMYLLQAQFGGGPGGSSAASGFFTIGGVGDDPPRSPLQPDLGHRTRESSSSPCHPDIEGPVQERRLARPTASSRTRATASASSRPEARTRRPAPSAGTPAAGYWAGDVAGERGDRAPGAPSIADGGVDAMAEFWDPDIVWLAAQGAIDDVGEIHGRGRRASLYPRLDRHLRRLQRQWWRNCGTSGMTASLRFSA